jgi:hypothetical protein
VVNDAVQIYFPAARQVSQAAQLAQHGSALQQIHDHHDLRTSVSWH